MIFLTDADFKKQIKTDILSAVIQADTQILNDAERATIAEITSYIALRYDAANVFNKTGDNRNALIVMFAVDILLYHIHSRLMGKETPEIRDIRYSDAIKWLKMVNAGEIFIDLPLKPNTVAAGNISYVGEEKRNNRF
jgi:phage gp36-like protein